MDKRKAPFNEEEIKNINKNQENGECHPFTCCSPDNIPECLRVKATTDRFEKNLDISYNSITEGILIATKDGLICPCGKYNQDWVYPPRV